MAVRYRVALLASHPIQYQVPLFRALAAHPEIDLTVFFCSDAGLKRYYDPGFGHSLQWDVPLLGGYRHRFLPNRSPVRGSQGPFKTINPRIIGYLASGNYDAIIINGWALCTFWIAFAAARALNIPIFLRGESNGLQELLGWKGRIKRGLLQPAFQRISGFLSIGTLNSRFYEGYGVSPSHIFSAPYSVNNDFFAHHAAALLPQKAHLRAQRGIPVDATVFLVCGKLTDVKSPLDALEAFAALPQENCYLVYAGDGVLRSAIEERCRDLGLKNVRITGFCNQSELPQWYATADALVLSSSFEPWGLVVNEAMNFGLPIICSDFVGSAPDLVRDGENGWTFPVGDVAALSKAMRRIASDEKLRAKMSNASRQIIQNWGISQTVEGYIRAFQSELGAK